MSPIDRPPNAASLSNWNLPDLESVLDEPRFRQRQCLLLRWFGTVEVFAAGLFRAKPVEPPRSISHVQDERIIDRNRFSERLIPQRDDSFFVPTMEDHEDQSPTESVHQSAYALPTVVVGIRRQQPTTMVA